MVAKLVPAPSGNDVGQIMWCIVNLDGQLREQLALSRRGPSRARQDQRVSAPHARRAGSNEIRVQIHVTALTAASDQLSINASDLSKVSRTYRRVRCGGANSLPPGVSR